MNNIIMSLTNKLFSLLGFAEPVTLNRFNGCNSLPQKVLLLSINQPVTPIMACIKASLRYLINQHNDNANTETAHTQITETSEQLAEKSIDALFIDASNYVDETSYQGLFSTVQQNLKYLTHNARIVLLATAASPQHCTINNTENSAVNSVEHHAFNQALIGFSKSLAKEVGRQGSTANVMFIKNFSATHTATENKKISQALNSSFAFLLSAKSAFVSGQVIKVNQQATSVIKSPPNSNKKIAVVTGAAQGIGAAIAQKLTTENYLVIGVDIEAMRELLTTTMQKLQGEAFILDVSAKQAGQQLAALAQQYNGFDLIVHNAGITRDKTLAKMPAHYWQQTLSINLLAVIHINSALLANNAINQGGGIVCLSSMNGIAGQGGQTNYACSKAGIIGYVASMAVELSANNIRINAVAPGFIETAMTAQIPYFTREMGRRMNALGQGGLPIDVAEAVSYLGCDSSYAISGQTVRVCGLNIIGA